MSQESTLQTVGLYKCLIVSILASAKITKPTSLELFEQLKNLLSDEEFTRLPLYAKEEIWRYSDDKRSQLIDEYTILLFNLDGGIRTITAPSSPHRRNNKGTLYWYEVKETCNDDGIITITKTPTDKVYLE